MKQWYLIVWKVEKIQKVNTKDLWTKNGRIMFLSNFLVCNSKKSKFLKEQETRG